MNRFDIFSGRIVPIPDGPYCAFAEVEKRDARIVQLEAALIHQYNEEWDVGDGITDAEKIEFLINQVTK